MEFDNRVELLHSISMSLCKCEELRKTRTTSIKRGKKLQKITGNDVIKGDQLIYIKYKR
jgi:hypothetical protein